MLNSKQRAFLKSLASNIDTILIVGKGGITPEIIKQADDAILKRELIKCRVLNNSDLTPIEVSKIIAEQTNSEVVQVIGNKFVLFRRNSKEPKIILPKKQ